MAPHRGRNHAANLGDYAMKEVQLYFISRGTLRYMSCYWEGLNGKEALWAAKKYSSHHSIPSDAAQLVREEVWIRDLQKK